MNLDDLTNRIPVDELQSIREKYCQSIESSGKNSEFCSPVKAELPDIPDWLPPGFLLLILSIVRESDELCDIYYEEFHGITDLSLVNNTYIAAGGQGMVFKCECGKEGIEPAVTAQKGKSWPATPFTFTLSEAFHKRFSEHEMKSKMARQSLKSILYA